MDVDKVKNNERIRTMEGDAISGGASFKAVDHASCMAGASPVIVNGTDIANRLFVPRSRVSMWAGRKTSGFPDPVAYGTGTYYRKYAPLWDLDEVMAWWEQFNRPKPAKPGNKGNRDKVPPKRKRKMAKTKQATVAKTAKVDLRSKMMERRFR